MYSTVPARSVHTCLLTVPPVLHHLTPFRGMNTTKIISVRVPRIGEEDYGFSDTDPLENPQVRLKICKIPIVQQK